MKKIKRIIPMSVAKTFALLYAILGFVIGIIVTLVGLVRIAGGEARGVLAIFAVILFPIFYGIIGAVFGYIGAWLYNLVAKKTGGVEFEVE